MIDTRAGNAGFAPGRRALRLLLAFTLLATLVGVPFGPVGARAQERPKPAAEKKRQAPTDAQGRGHATEPQGRGRPTVLIALHPGGGRLDPETGRPLTVFERLAARPALSLGFLGATQGQYSRRQALLDLTAGNRVSRSGYEPNDAPRFRIAKGKRGWEVHKWRKVVARAGSAPTDIVPGLLAGSVPGGAAFVGTREPPGLDAVLAANPDGRIPAVDIGRRSTLPARIERQLGERQLVVVALPGGTRGYAVLDRLLSKRPPEQLVVAMKRPPRSKLPQMLPIGIAGLFDGGTLTSRTTRLEGLVVTTDLMPTVLEWLGQPVPPQAAGRAILAQGHRDPAELMDLENRLRVVYPRRFPALYAVFIALATAALMLSLWGGAAGRRQALRVCALAIFWIPFVSLLCAALEPSRRVELLLMGAGTVVLGALCDRFVAWPRAPAIPALLGVTAYVLDLARGSDLIVRSLLGPNPRFGSRFYGIGNELEATLPVLLLIGLAAAAAAVPRSRRLAATFGIAMLVLGAAIGAGRLGADVGGVITVGAGAAAAVVVLLPGGVSRRAIALALAVPALALMALAAIDIVTGGDAHFTNTVLGADGPQALARTIGRRYELAWQTFLRGVMPVVTLVAIIATVYAWRRRHVLYAAVLDSPAWQAALVGGLAGSVAGTLTNDSGPVLLAVGVFVLAWATAYVRGDPRLAPVDSGSARTASAAAATDDADTGEFERPVRTGNSAG